MAKLKKDIVLLLIILIITVAIIILYLIHLININSEWIGFWGSFLGSIIGIYGIYWQFSKQNKLLESKEKKGALIFLLNEIKYMKNYYKNYYDLLYKTNVFTKFPEINHEYIENLKMSNTKKRIFDSLIMNLTDEVFFYEVIDLIDFQEKAENELILSLNSKEERVRILESLEKEIKKYYFTYKSNENEDKLLNKISKFHLINTYWGNVEAFQKNPVSDIKDNIVELLADLPALGFDDDVPLEFEMEISRLELYLKEIENAEEVFERVQEVNKNLNEILEKIEVRIKEIK